MYCESRETLKKLWDKAARTHTDAVKAMEAVHTGILEPQRADLASKIEARRIASENARVAYSIHCKEHGC
jgi:hypothetical protein